MLKSILNLEGVTELKKDQQRKFNGGRTHCGDAFYQCDKNHPNDFGEFDSCMKKNFCGWDQEVQL